MRKSQYNSDLVTKLLKLLNAQTTKLKIKMKKYKIKNMNKYNII